MTRRYSLVIEGDEAGYSAYVPELPTILVTGRSMEELTARVRSDSGLLASGARRLASRRNHPGIEVELPAAK